MACPHSALLVSPTALVTVGNGPGGVCLPTVSHRRKVHPRGLGSQTVFSPRPSLKPGNVPGAEDKLRGHRGSEMNGYRNPTRLCARGNFRSQLQSTLPAPNLHGTMTQEALQQLSQCVTVTVGQVSPWVTQNTSDPSPQPGAPSSHRGCHLCALGAVRRAGGGPLAGLTSVTTSPTSPATAQPTWDSRSE